MSSLTLSIGLNYARPKRKMTVTRAPGSNDQPMLRISNRLLTSSGFNIGTPIEVSYQSGTITITKVNL